MASHTVLLPALVLPRSGSSGRWQGSHPLSPVSPSSRVIIGHHSTVTVGSLSTGKCAASLTDPIDIEPFTGVHQNMPSWKDVATDGCSCAL
jgi:hypothetical protein